MAGQQRRKRIDGEALVQRSEARGRCSAAHAQPRRPPRTPHVPHGLQPWPRAPPGSCMSAPWHGAAPWPSSLGCAVSSPPHRPLHPAHRMAGRTGPPLTCAHTDGVVCGAAEWYSVEAPRQGGKPGRAARAAAVVRAASRRASARGRAAAPAARPLPKSSTAQWGLGARMAAMGRAAAGPGDSRRSPHCAHQAMPRRCRAIYRIMGTPLLRIWERHAWFLRCACSRSSKRPRTSMGGPFLSLPQGGGSSLRAAAGDPPAPLCGRAAAAAARQAAGVGLMGVLGFSCAWRHAACAGARGATWPSGARARAGTWPSDARARAETWRSGPQSRGGRSPWRSCARARAATWRSGAAARAATWPSGAAARAATWPSGAAARAATWPSGAAARAATWPSGAAARAATWPSGAAARAATWRRGPRSQGGRSPWRSGRRAPTSWWAAHPSWPGAQGKGAGGGAL
ncbi:MAG: hypothetical protein J3K34DRAFT_59396 [Monoraphidium minutum]|nr:MAG: hypothetical protein J3K34DRAFT_59396 [Monoraphidium minutum]